MDQIIHQDSTLALSKEHYDYLFITIDQISFHFGIKISNNIEKEFLDRKYLKK